MNHPKLLPSQELVLHQVSVDAFSPAAPSVLKFPTSPLLSRSPFSPTGASAASSPSPSSSHHPPAAIAASSIVRPQIRQRDEWTASLRAVESFELPATALHSSSFDHAVPVPVRYIADRYDRAWLSRRPVLAVRGEDGGVAVLRGKTGGLGSHVPIESHLSTAALEDVFTALELAAHSHPAVPLERLLPYAQAEPATAVLSAEALEELHAYWLLRRNATGGLLSVIPELRTIVREDNELALCQPAVLRDCPLPFKQRDWYVPVMERRRPAEQSASGGVKRSRSPMSGGAAPLEACAESAEKALRLSRAALQREEARLTHTHLTLYELAYLRGLGGGRCGEEEVASQHGGSAPVGRQALSHFLATVPYSGEDNEVANSPDVRTMCWHV